MKALVGAFNQEKALLGAFSVIMNLRMDLRFKLYYLDVRANNRLGPTVRVLGMINRLEPSVKTQCQLWFSEDKPGSEPVVSRVLEYKYIWDKQWGNYKQGREREGGRQSC